MIDDQEICLAILSEAWKRSPHRGVCDHPTLEKRGENPACGDVVSFSLEQKDGRIQNLKHRGDGCAVSQASAALLADLLQNLTVPDAMILLDNAAQFLRGEHDGGQELMNFAALRIIRGNPARQQCAMVAVSLAISMLAAPAQN